MGTRLKGIQIYDVRNFREFPIFPNIKTILPQIIFWAISMQEASFESMSRFRDHNRTDADDFDQTRRSCYPPPKKVLQTFHHKGQNA